MDRQAMQQQEQLVKQQFLTQFDFLCEEDIEQLWTAVKVEQFPAKGRIREAGKRAEKIYYIVNGAIRGYFLELSGEERTLFIRPAGKFFGPPEVLQEHAVSDLIVEALQPCVLLTIDHQALMSIIGKSLSIARLYTLALEENILVLVFRVKILASKTPHERYEILLKAYPEIFQQAQLKYIANFLGITPTSLSRIIKRKQNERT
ncbi:Crp/Fnr family transcriptional regulator [Lewinella sp. LCG006]|uniref:Crp/Fnr family transcriptional regulator n=1 Tax=Lewinella sp. LCG006 TaxID=3231911 RepID=UPI0034613D0A